LLARARFESHTPLTRTHTHKYTHAHTANVYGVRAKYNSNENVVLRVLNNIYIN